MEPDRFDALSRTLAASSSRRKTLGALGAGGLLAAVFGRVGQAEAAASTCQLKLSASVQIGSDKKGKFSGQLTLQVGSDGAIDHGALATDDGFNFNVVGQATGRLIGLHVTDAN